MLIDFHAHAFLDKLAAGAVASLAAKAHIQPNSNGTVADTLRIMREQKVDRSVILSIAVSPRTEHHVNDFAISLLQEPKFIPFGSVHPDSPNAISELKRLKSAGICGVKFHNEYQDFYVDDERAFPIYEKCAELGLIMLFHGGADLGFAPPVKTPPKRMRRVCLTFPEAKIVVAHLGGQRMEEEAAEYLADTNAYIDTSYAATAASPEVGMRTILAFGFDRVLFGTDLPWDTAAHTLSYLESMGFTEEQKEKIYCRNALRLLGLQ